MYRELHGDNYKGILKQQVPKQNRTIKVGGMISDFGDILLDETTPLDIGQRVIVLIINEEDNDNYP
jgi:hypothetical protein